MPYTTVWLTLLILSSAYVPIRAYAVTFVTVVGQSMVALFVGTAVCGVLVTLLRQRAH